MADWVGVEPDRRILIVDRPDGQLQQLAMDLLGRDFEVHYASDSDEAQLLAGETDGQINVVIFSAGLEIERVPDLAARFCVSPESLIPFGERPPARVVAALAHHGVKWHLWDEPTDESIRFVISGVLYDHDPFELRYHLRVPTNVRGHYERGGHKCETQIRDLGLGGACAIGGLFGEAGDAGELSFNFQDRAVCLPVRTAWSAPDDNQSLAVAGLSFLEVDHESGEVIDDLLTSILVRHRIEKPA